MEKNRPQLSRDEVQQLRWLLGGVLSLISVWTVWYLEIDAWILASLTTGAVLLTLARPDLPARVPPRIHKFAFPFIVAFFAWDLYSTAQWLPAVIRLDMLLLLYRGCSYRQKRDDLQIIVLGLFLVTAAGVITVSLEFAVQMLVFTATTLAFLFVVTLAESMDGAPEPPARNGKGPSESRVAPGPGAPPAWAAVRWRKLARRLREVADWRLLALGGVLFAGVVAVSALLFLAIPRFQLDSGFFLNRFISAKSRTGFSDSIHLGDVIDIQQDTSVALRVDVSDPARVPAVPYWRMVVLDEYRDGQLRTSQRLRNGLTLNSQTSSLVRDQLRAPPGPPVSWTFYFESGISRFLPLCGSFTILRFREPQQVLRQPQLRIVALRNEPVTMTAYRVEGMVADGFLPDRLFGDALRKAQQAAAESRPARPATAERSRLQSGYPLTTLLLPDQPGERQALRRMAEEVTGGASLSAAEFAARARSWLDAKHGYSLKVELAGADRDPVVAWMESDQPGHCELFTAAFTLLARAAGYPTRAVTGFKGGDWNAYENYFMVRNSQAHAWCEIYDGSTGWIRVDPTDGSALIGAGPQNQAGVPASLGRLDRSWGARLDSIRILWYRRVVSFDQRTQLELVQLLQETTDHFRAALRGALDGAASSFRQWLRRPWDARRLLGWLGGAGLAAAVAILWWIRGRPWWWRVRGSRARGGVDPVRREAGRLLRRMRGLRQAEDEGQEVVAELLRLRFGPRGSWPEPQAVFRRARRTAREWSHGRRTGSLFER
jgi:transglutaminase-like putative cysteine protease